MSANDPVVITSAARTPIGAMLGELSTVPAPRLGAAAIRAAVERAGIEPEQVQEVLMGCVLPAGLGQAPARQATLFAGLPASAGATTVNKMCGSGMKATMLAHDLLLAGSQDIVVSGGMENMSSAPYLIEKARRGLRYGHGTLLDHMAIDGLEDAYEKTPGGGGRSMGTYAEDLATQMGLTRAEQEAFSIESAARARRANEDDTFVWEMAPVAVPDRQRELFVERDESPFRIDPARVPKLRPAFRQDGTITAATSSSISDGAAALVLMRQSTAERIGAAPLARIVSHATHSLQPEQFPIAPVGAIRKLLARTGWQAADVDLFEINEAFAVVTMAAMKELGLPHDRVNVNGGAVALGHPIGATGARILVTLLGAMRARRARRGVAALCIGGGEATAMALELL